MKKIICFKILIFLLSSASLFCHDYKGLFLRYDRLSPYEFVESNSNQLNLSECSIDSTKIIKDINPNNTLLKSSQENNKTNSMIFKKLDTRITRNQLILNIESIETTNFKIYIIDLLGNILIKKVMLTNYGTSEFSINLDGLCNGLYTLSILSENTKFTESFIYNY